VLERFTERSKRVLAFSQDEARLLGHNFIGTEHLLLGILRETDCVAAHCLRQLGVSLPVIRQMLETTIGPVDGELTKAPPFTPRSKKVLELSLREARQLGHEYIGTEHILLGLIREGEGLAVQILQSLGVAPSRVRGQVVSAINGASPASSEPPVPIPAVPFEGHRSPLLRNLSQSMQPNVSDWARYPTRILPGRARRLGSDGLYFRVVGVLLYDEGVQVLWRMSGIPKPIADWMRDPAAFSPALQNERSVAFVVLRDDVGTDYTAAEPRMGAQSETEWAGSSTYTPATPASALRLSVEWQDETIDIEVRRPE
jgi:hypothetical protein